jgi:hypothetical protein
MNKLYTILGIFLLLTVLAGCTPGGETTVTPPSFVGVSVDGTNPYNGTEYVRYYKEKNENTLIEVVLNNPDNLDIRAIVVNSYSFRSNNFLNGGEVVEGCTDGSIVSTNKNVFFCMSAGDTLELTEYTVDDIEYFNGSDTLDVLVEANNEFHFYVYRGIPSVVRENYNIKQDSISVDFDVTDDDNVILPGTLVAKVYLGTVEVEELQKELNAGYNSVKFDTNIMSDTNYEIKIFADYDRDDTTGVHEDEVLFSGNFTTLPTLLPNATIENVAVSSNSVEFDVIYDDVDSVTVPGGSRVAIFDGDTEVASVGLNGSVEGVSFDDLLNSKEYSIRVISNYDLRNGDGTHTEYVLSSSSFETSARQVPEPRIENIRVEENRILFDVFIDDDPLDPIIDITTLYANVYVDDVLEDTLQISGSSVEIQINDVLSGKDVRIEFLATYDLNDGNGAQDDQVIGVFERVSLLNSPPSVNIKNVEVTQGYINIDLTISDVSNTLLSSVRAILYSVEEVDGVEIETYIDTQFLSLEETETTFAHLVEAAVNYRIKILADYNLLDGEGNRNNQVLFTQEITNIQPKAPAAEIHDPIITNNGLGFNVIVMDADDTVEDNSLFIYVYKDGVVQESLTRALVVGMNTISYTGLNSDYTYDFVIEADFDILDGSGLQENQELLQQSLMTTAKQLPTASIGTRDSTTESITFDVAVVDIDDVVETGTIFAELYYNNTSTGLRQPLVIGENAAVSFTGINSDTPYTIKIIVDYDLDNGENIVSAYPMLEFTYNTEAKELPAAVIENIIPSTDSITFDVILSDVDSVLTSQARAELYIGETYTGQSITLDEGINSDVEFTGVYSNQPYIILIVADYDLNDNINILTGDQIAYSFAETLPNQMVTAEFYEINVAIESITFSAQVIDDSGVVTTDLRAYLIEDGLETGEFIDLIVGNNVGQTFINLNSDSLYTIEIRTNFDLGDMDGAQSTTLATFSSETSAYTAPSATITSVTVDYDSVVFDVTVLDTSNTSTGDYKAILYYQGLRTAQEIIITEGLNQLQSFDTLYSGVEYEIKIEAVYDLRDGEGEHTELVASRNLFTTAKRVPIGSATDLSITENQVYFRFDYVDSDNTLIDDTFIAWLYDEDLNLIDSTNVSNAEVYFDLSYMPSNYNFTVRITGDYDLSTGPWFEDDGVILSLDLTTYINQIPTVIISQTKINQTDVTFYLNVSDIDSVVIGDLTVDIYDSLDVFVGTVTVPLSYSEELGNYYDGYVTVPGVTLTEGLLHNLLVVADYNLRDGELLQVDQIIGDAPIIAVYKIIPQAHIYNVLLDTNSIQFDVMLYDNHTAYIGGAEATLYKDGVQVGLPVGLIIGLNDDVTFAVPTSDADYQLVITLDYDNLDGNLTITDYIVADEIYHSVAKQVPVASGIVESTGVDSAVLDITVVDGDGVINANRQAIIYIGGVDAGLAPISLIDGFNDDVALTGLLSDTNYEARIFADYDLGDGVTVLTGELIGTVAFTTQAKVLPTAEISNVITDKDSITFDLDVTDIDSVLVGNIEVKLFKNGVYTGDTVSTALLTDTLVFNTVDSDSDFRFDVIVDYDLTNGYPVYLNKTITSADATTFANEAATADIAGIVTDHNSVTFNVTVTDVDGIIDDNLKVILVSGGVATGQEFALTTGSTTGITFDTLYSIRTYQIVVIADIDWKDGSPIRTESQLDAEAALTTETFVPLATFSNYVLTNSTITLDINVWDDTETIVDNLRAEVYLDEVSTGQFVSLVPGDNIGVEFTGLDYGIEYEIRVMGDYNDNYESIDVPDYLIYYELINTVPLVELADVVAEIFEVNFKVTVDDGFGIMANQIMLLEIYDETNTLIESHYTVGTSTIQFSNYLNDELYRVDIYANITGEASPILVSVQELAVPARTLQTVLWTDIVATATTIATDVTITLPDTDNLVIDDGTPVVASLYSIVGGVVTFESSITLSDGINNLLFTLGSVDAGTSYMIVIEGTCNFNDGLGDQVGYAISARTFVALP